MHGRQKWTLALFATMTLLTGGAGQCAAEPYQSHEDFVAAIRDRSSSPYIVLLTAIDDRSEQAHTGCTNAHFLTGAIHIELWRQIDVRAPRDELKSRSAEAERIAIEHTSHVFHFSNPAALQSVFPFPNDRRYSKACEAIARGVRARFADRTGELLLGPFIKEPEIVARSCPFPLPREQHPNNPNMPTISLLIAPDGTLRESKVMNSSGSRGIDEGARAALSSCKYKPRIIDDEPAQEAAWLTVQIYGGWPFRH
jgi:hypothetical protein